MAKRKIKVDTSQKSTRVFTLDISQKEFEEQLSKIAREYQKKAKIRGFRPGKAPLELIYEIFGEELKEETIKELIQNKVKEESEIRDLKIVSPIFLKNVEKKTDGGYKATVEFEVLPHFEPPVVHDIKVKRIVRRITEIDVEARINQLREKMAELIESPNELSEPGDYLIVDYEERDENSKLVDKMEDAYLPLDPKEINPELIEKLIKRKRGETVEVPFEHKTKEGLKLKRTYIYKIKGIKKKILPNTDDNFAMAWGYKDLKDMETKIREELEELSRKRQEEEMERQIIEEIYKRTPFEVPKTLISQKVEELKNKLKIKEADLNKETLTELEKIATQLVIEEIILDRYAEKFGVQVDEEELIRESEKLAQGYKVDKQRFFENLKQRGILPLIELQLKRKKTMEKLKELVKLEVIIQ